MAFLCDNRRGRCLMDVVSLVRLRARGLVFVAVLLSLVGCSSLLGVDLDGRMRDGDESAKAPGAGDGTNGAASDANGPAGPVSPKADGTCDAGFARCGDRCVATDDPAFGCGAPTCAPCAVPNASATCKPRESGGGYVCAVAACASAWKDCNGSPFDGCEAPPPLDPGGCAACDVACLVREADDGVVTAGRTCSCRVRPDGTAACWGGQSFGEKTIPANVGKLQAISAGLYHTCALRTDGQIVCWGTNESGRATPPPGAFTAVSTGGYHTCGLRGGGAVECWGTNGGGQSTPPAGSYRAVSAGASHTCAIRLDGTVTCWGSYGAPLTPPPAGTFRQVSAGNGFTCGVKTNGDLVCWDGARPQMNPTPGAYRQVSVGSQYVCAIKTDGSVQCWGYNGSGQASAPVGAFRQISAGEQHACGELLDGTVTCWGANDSGQVSPVTP
jgi:hypothetical protein